MKDKNLCNAIWILILLVLIMCKTNFEMNTADIQVNDYQIGVMFDRPLNYHNSEFYMQEDLIYVVELRESNAPIAVGNFWSHQQAQSNTPKQQLTRVNGDNTSASFEGTPIMSKLLYYSYANENSKCGNPTNNEMDKWVCRGQRARDITRKLDNGVREDCQYIRLEYTYKDKQNQKGSHARGSWNVDSRLTPGKYLHLALYALIPNVTNDRSKDLVSDPGNESGRQTSLTDILNRRPGEPSIIKISLGIINVDSAGNPQSVTQQEGDERVADNQLIARVTYPRNGGGPCYLKLPSTSSERDKFLDGFFANEVIEELEFDGNGSAGTIQKATTKKHPNANGVNCAKYHTKIFELGPGEWNTLNSAPKQHGTIRFDYQQDANGNWNANGNGEKKAKDKFVAIMSEFEGSRAHGAIFIGSRAYLSPTGNKITIPEVPADSSTGTERIPPRDVYGYLYVKVHRFVNINQNKDPPGSPTTWNDNVNEYHNGKYRECNAGLHLQNMGYYALPQRVQTWTRVQTGAMSGPEWAENGYPVQKYIGGNNEPTAPVNLNHEGNKVTHQGYIYAKRTEWRKPPETGLAGADNANAPQEIDEPQIEPE